jgi:hypothetical protein
MCGGTPRAISVSHTCMTRQQQRSNAQHTLSAWSGRECVVLADVRRYTARNQRVIHLHDVATAMEQCSAYNHMRWYTTSHDYRTFATIYAYWLMCGGTPRAISVSYTCAMTRQQQRSNAENNNIQGASTLGHPT